MNSHVDETMRIDAVVHIWIEASENGQEWFRSERAETVTETGRDCRELRAILATYVRWAEIMGPRWPTIRPWFRVVMQGAESGTVLAVVPRRWNAERWVYETTGGEWMITDNSAAYQAWFLNLARTRLTAERRATPKAA